MRKQDRILRIDSPCNENWADMKESGNGRFCSHCSKTVVDFTELTDDEIIKLLISSSGNVCGQLSHQQLSRTIKPKKPIHHKNLRKIATGILFISGVFQSAYTSGKMSAKTEMVPGNAMKSTTIQKHPVDRPGKDSLKNVIIGTVLDSSGNEPLAGVSIFIKGTKIEAITNLQGHFTLKIPDDFLTKEITIVAMYIGYGNLEATFERNELPATMSFLLAPSKCFLGEVVIIKKKRWWQFWK